MRDKSSALIMEKYTLSTCASSLMYRPSLDRRVDRALLYHRVDYPESFVCTRPRHGCDEIPRTAWLSSRRIRHGIFKCVRSFSHGHLLRDLVRRRMNHVRLGFRRSGFDEPNRRQKAQTIVILGDCLPYSHAPGRRV
jgi:hypothetical protein